VTLPTEAEFEASVNRLGKAGLVDAAANGFAVTEAGRSILDRFGAGRAWCNQDDARHQGRLAEQQFPVTSPGFVMTMHPVDWEEAQREAHERFLEWKAKHQPL